MQNWINLDQIVRGNLVCGVGCIALLVAPVAVRELRIMQSFSQREMSASCRLEISDRATPRHATPRHATPYQNHNNFI